MKEEQEQEQNNDAEDEEENEETNTGMSEEDAAIRIEAHMRGKQDREKVRLMKEEKQKQKEDTERIHGFGINEIQPGEIYYVPIHAAPQCTIHVRPKADDKPDGTPADQEDNVSWSYLSNLFEEGK